MAISNRMLTLRDRRRGRDEAIVDFRHGFITRREFLQRVTAVGVSAGFAMTMADAIAAPDTTPRPSRWSKQADATVTFIKGPHHPDDQKFWDQLKADFEAANPGIALNPTFFKWQTMDAELTAGYASQIPVEDRWAIAAYVKALQLSQDAAAAD